MKKGLPHETSPVQTAHAGRISDRMLLGLALATMLRTADAVAGDQLSGVHTSTNGKLPQTAPTAATVLANPQIFTAPPLMDQPFSSTDFTPRKHTLFDTGPAANSVGDTPLLSGTSVWQRLSQYKSHDRVRLLTLWQSSGSSVSLQAGRRGDPSLQWTSRLADRGDGSQGLLDRWLTASLARARIGLKSFAHPADSTANPASAKSALP
jgi:hypothetical protein